MDWDRLQDYGWNWEYVYRIGGAILVLVIGLLLAGIIGRAVAKMLSKTSVDNSGRKYLHDKSSLSNIIGQVVKYLIILLTILAVLEILDFTSVMNPFAGFVDTVARFLPNLLAAGLLAVIAHILGTLLKNILSGALSSEPVRRRMPRIADYADFFGKVAYALVWLLFAPAILDRLNIDAISQPIGNVIDTIINYLPLFVGAVILVIIGHFIAKFVADLVGSLASSAHLNRWTGSNVDVPKIIRNIVYFLVLFPIVVQALDLLQIESIQRPANYILSLIIAWIPRIIVAVFLLYLGYLLAKIVKGLALTLLSPFGLDRRLAALLPAMRSGAAGTTGTTTTPGATGITPSTGPRVVIHDTTTGDVTQYGGTTNVVPPTPPADASATSGAAPGGVGAAIKNPYSVTEWIANLIAVLIFGFFLVEATNTLELRFISNTFAEIMELLPRIVLAALVILAGIILANMVERMMNPNTPGRSFVKPVIITIASVIALTEIGLAGIVVTSGFMIVLGGLAAAFIISVGIGSIQAVRRYWEERQGRR